MSDSIKDYSEDGITVMEGTDAIRKRPGMYIGNMWEYGFANLFTQYVLQMLVDHKCDRLKIDLKNDREYVVYGYSKEIVVEKILHRFEHMGYEKNTEWKPGLNWFYVLNALSVKLELSIQSEAKKVIALYEKGKRQSYEELGSVTEDGFYLGIRFVLDSSLLNVTSLPFMNFVSLIHILCCLCGNKRLNIIDNRHQEICSANFTVEGLKDLAASKFPLRMVYPEPNEPVCFSFNEDNLKCDVYIRSKGSWNNNDKYHFSFVNGEATSENGSHLEGVFDGIVDAATRKNPGKETDYALGRDRLINDKDIIVSVWLDAPSFAGSSKSQLSMQSVRNTIARNVSEHLPKILEGQKQETRFFMFF